MHALLTLAILFGIMAAVLARMSMPHRWGRQRRYGTMAATLLAVFLILPIGASIVEARPEEHMKVVAIARSDAMAAAEARRYLADGKLSYLDEIRFLDGVSERQAERTRQSARIALLAGVNRHPQSGIQR